MCKKIRNMFLIASTSSSSTAYANVRDKVDNTAETQRQSEADDGSQPCCRQDKATSTTAQ